MKKALLRILALALAVAPVCSCSVFAGDEVSRARLGSLHRNDMVVVDVRRGVDTNDVMEAIGTYDRDVIQPREAAIHIPVTSVNTRTGDVVLTVKEISGAVDADTVQGMIDRIPPPPVTSVNGRTGVVSLGVREIPGAVDTTAVQAAIAAYDNDVVVPREGKIVSGGYAFPVTSVNSKTGAVVLAVGDISGAACESRTVVVTNYVEGSTSGDGNAVEGVDYSVVTNVYHVVYGDDIARLKAESEAYADGAVRDLYGDTIYPSLTSLASAATANHRFLHTLSSNNYVSAYRANERAWQLEAWQYTNSVTRTDFEAGFTDWAVTPIWAVGRLTVAQISGGTDAGKWSLFRPQTNEYSSLTALVTPVAASNDATEIQWPNSEFTYVDHGTNRTVVIDVVARRIRLSPDFSVGNAKLVATIQAKAPKPDFTASNSTLVATIQAKAPKPDFTASNSTLVATIAARVPDYDNVRLKANNAIQPDYLTSIIAPINNRLYSADIHVTTEDKAAWNSKYSKPAGGIPVSDLSSGASNSLALADSAVQPNDLAGINLHTGDTTIHVTSAKKEEWDAKYSKPADGIPIGDLSSAVRNSLALADSAVQPNDLVGFVTADDVCVIVTNEVPVPSIVSVVRFDYTVEPEVETNISTSSIISIEYVKNGPPIWTENTEDDDITNYWKVVWKITPDSATVTGYDSYNGDDSNSIMASPDYALDNGVIVTLDRSTRNALGFARLSDVPKKTSDLVNDGSSGEHPFISQSEVQHQQLALRGPNHDGYSAWTIKRDGVDVTSQVKQPAWYDDPEEWNVYGSILPYDDVSVLPLSYSPNATSLSWTVETIDDPPVSVPYTATRTALPGYVLGTQTDKPLQPQGDYAVKSEMSVTHGTGADADKATIQLKAGTSATVLTTHQDISDLVRITDLATVTNGIGPVRVGADTSVAKDVSVSIGFGAYSSAVEQTHATHNGWKRGIAIGQDAIASAAGVSIGPRAGMSSEATSGSISIGLNSTAASQDAIAIGNGAGWTGDGYASNMGRYSVAVGTLAGSEGADSAAFGSSAHTFGSGAVAVGNRAKAGTESVSVGRDSSTSNCNSSIAIGLRAATSAQRSIAIGHNARAAVSSLAIGSYTGDAYTEAGNSSIAIGAGAKSCTDSGSSGISIGYLASTPNGGTAIGANASANSSAIAIGTWSAATGSWATAYGYKATARVNGSTSIGAWADASGLGSVAIGGGRGKWGSSPSDTPAAAATATESIQLGVGTNSVANTFQVWGHRMLDKNTGEIPVARIPDTIARKSEIPSTDAIISALTNSPAFMEAITNSIVFKSAVSNAVADSVAAELEAADSANPRSVAMFSIPINSEGAETRYTGIELKCSTNNFADVTYFANVFTDEYDGISMFVQNVGDDKRAYTRVEGTESEIATTIGDATELVVLVSAADCKRNDGGWLNSNNDDAAWTFVRLRAGEREQNTDGSAMWRTCAPIRWFRRMPEWAIQSE